MITNKKQTAAAIKAAVDQAKKVRPIEYTIKKGNSFKKRIDAYWKKQKEVKAIKRRNEIRNETEFNLLKEWVTDYKKRNKK